MRKKYSYYYVVWLFLLTIVICGCIYLGKKIEIQINTENMADAEVETDITTKDGEEEKEEIEQISPVSKENNEAEKVFEFSLIPEYSGEAYVVVNDNVPFFTDEDMVTTSYEFYSRLDELGRCGVCVASVGTDIMPETDREGIGNVKPSGWNQAKYPEVVNGNYLYNRCHLIGFQLTGENDNKSNLITGTRYLNIEGMLAFENMIADYVKETGNHVMYRVTPIFENDNLLASGVLIEAKSVEDDGEDVLFCVYCYNVQPGVLINYEDGSSSLEIK